MANYNDLITAIDSVIKTNNRREITGQLLQNVLNTMVGSLGENYQLAGFATPTTNPHQPDQNVFYIASQAGVYTQFDNIVLGDGISFLMWKNGAWTSQTIANVTQSWVQQNYVSKEWFRKVFRVYDEDGLEIVPNDMDSVVDNIKAMVGLWTNEYLSALGMGRDGGGTTQTLAQLNDVQLGTLENGDALVYNSAIHKWENKQIQAGVDMSVVWAALAANTNEQINASHLATALSGYVTTAALGTTLQNYATQSWVNQNYATQSWVNQNFITVEWFDKLFQLYNGTEAEANKIAPNGALPVDQTQLNIEAMFGFWTKKYISALGKGDDGSTSYTTLAQLNDVTLTNPTANQVLTYNGTRWVNRTISLGSQSLSGLTDVAITNPAANQMLSYDATIQKWVNAAIPATGVTSVALSMPTGFSITGSPITASGTFTVAFASGYSLPTTAKQSNWDTAYSWGNHASAGYAAASSLSNYLPLSGGTLTGTGGSGGEDYGLLTLSVTGHSSYLRGIMMLAPNLVAGNDILIGLGTANSKYNLGQLYFHQIGDGSSSNRISIGLHSQDNVLNVLASGDVGIGTVSPSYKLHVNGSANATTLYENGTSLSSKYLALSGGNLTGSLSIVNALDIYRDNAPSDIYKEIAVRNDSSATYIEFPNDRKTKFGTRGSNKYLFTFDAVNQYIGIGDENPAYKLEVSGSFRASVNGIIGGNLTVGSASGSYVQIGAIQLQYDSSNNAIKVVKSDGTAANLYATGGVSALGAGQESGGGGDVTWALLASPATGGRTIHSSYISSALSNYLPLSGGTMTGILKVKTGYGISDASDNGLLVYHPVDWTGVSSSQWGVGAVDSIGVIRTSNNDLIHYRAGFGNSYIIDDTGGTLKGSLTFSYNNRNLRIKTTSSGQGIDIPAVDEWLIRTDNTNTQLLIGNVGIGLYSPSYKLHVTGTVGATGFTNTSDIRNKNVIKDVDLRLDQIAKAPAFEYYWLDTSIDHDLHVGTSAQYWESVLPQVVTTAKDEIGTKAMQYGVAALISAITVARRVMTHEEKIALLETRISALEKENGEQEQLINSLQEELAKFKAA